jgi:tetratricopeptide (TPR) repeat protein
MSLERWDEARAEFEEVRRRRPEHPRAALGLGLLAMRAGDWNRGVTLLTPLGDDPTSRRAARSALAEIAARQGDSATATIHRGVLDDLPRDLPWEDTYMEAVQKRQAGLFQKLDLASTLVGRRQYEQAEELINEIIRLHPESDEAFLSRGKLYLATGDPTRAQEAAQRAVELSPNMPAAHFLLGAARFQQGNLASAEAAFRAAVAVQPDHAGAHYFIGECRRKQNDIRGAMVAYRDAVRYRPNMTEAHVALGSALLAAGEPAAARAPLQAALRLKPDNATAKQLLKEAESRK